MSRNAGRLAPKVCSDVALFLGLQWTPEQIPKKVNYSHESVNLHVYVNKAAGGGLHKYLSSQKPSCKRHLWGRERRGQIPNRRPIRERPSHIEDRKQVGQKVGNTVIGVAHKQAIVTLVERKSGFAILTKVSKKSADSVDRDIEAKLKALKSRLKMLRWTMARSLPISRTLIRPSASRPTLSIPIAVGSAKATRTSIVCYAGTSPRSGRWKISRISN